MKPPDQREAPDPREGDVVLGSVVGQPTAALHTRDIAKGILLARQIESGICHINGPTVQDEPQMPFGGVKGSGYGRFGGKWHWQEHGHLRGPYREHGRIGAEIIPITPRPADNKQAFKPTLNRG